MQTALHQLSNRCHQIPRVSTLCFLKFTTLHSHPLTLHSLSSFCSLFSVQRETQHLFVAMSEQNQHRQPQHQTDNFKNFFNDNGPSTSKVLAVVTLLPVGGTLLALAGLSLIATLIGLAIATPLFLIFSPILVPAALVLAGSVAGFLTSGAFGITGLSSLSWIANYLRGMRCSMSQQLDQAKRRAQDTAGQLGQRTRDVGQKIQNRSQDAGRTTNQEGNRDQESGKNQEASKK